MNADHFRAAAADMDDTALWDVLHMALLACRRDDSTPAVRYFEDAVTEALRSLHHRTQEALWDELQKHELGKRTLRALAAEYKPARMVAFEPDDLRRASLRFWEALQVEDKALRDALAAYDYEAASGLLSKLSATLAREVVGRLVYINCPRANVLEAAVGTIQLCSVNELKMLAKKLYDRLDRTGTLSAENKEFAKMLPHCKTKEELRVAVRDLMQMFKRKPPPGEADPSSHLIGPSVATVEVSYQGQNAVVWIQRLDKLPDNEPMGGQPATSVGPSKAPSAKPTQPVSVIGVTTRGSDIRSPKPAASPKATPAGLGSGDGMSDDQGSVRSSHTTTKPAARPSAHGGPAAAAVPSSHSGKVGANGSGSDVGSTKSCPTHETTTPGSTLGAVADVAAAASDSSDRSAKTIKASSVLGGPVTSARSGSEEQLGRLVEPQEAATAAAATRADLERRLAEEKAARADLERKLDEEKAASADLERRLAAAEAARADLEGRLNAEKGPIWFPCVLCQSYKQCFNKTWICGDCLFKS
ncbi:hypothetical protein PLESTB_000332300 [Pleodorina starrii]|uniref:Uncharacterized protein n=1 Tax=Pleodorina starrii TaxID=330485 RepID=A0A9W6BD81_9CHLO|nr:hypothetical protein PLESTM_001881400 [Pleodorina starrii]GLC50006.1 hypothetical protein PLESTB_000332300 [Pleodorina starrii]GLC75141.1 hypothetical protein PLESTF_001598400 [Pleodorina starrii]